MFSFPVITTALYIIGQEMIYDRFVITVGQTVELQDLREVGVIFVFAGFTVCSVGFKELLLFESECLRRTGPVVGLRKIIYIRTGLIM